MELTEEEKRMIKNWPERAISIGIKKIFGFEIKEGQHGQYDNVIITEAPSDLRSN